MLKVFWSLFLLFSISLSASAQQGGDFRDFGRRSQDRVMIGSDLMVREDEQVGDVVVIGGNANINGNVEGDVTVIGGALTLDGHIRGELKVVLGKAVISENSEIGGEVHLIGGPFVVHPNASILHEVNQVNFGDLVPKVEWFKQWVFQGLVLGRPIAPGVPWTWYAAAIFLGIYFVVCVAFPQPIQASVLAVEKNPVTALMTGLLSLFLLGPLVLLLIVSVVGIITIPFLFCGVFLVFLFGKTAIFGLVGKSLTGAIGLNRFPLWMAVLLGGFLLGITYVVPIVGMLMWGASTIVGVGAVVLAISQSLKKEAASMPPVAVQLKEGPLTEPTPALGLTPQLSTGSSTDVMLLQRAGFWRRLAAGFLDFILISFTGPVTQAALPLVFLVYLVGMWTLWGSTIGGMVMGIKVVRLDGRRVNWAVSLVRGLSMIFSALVFFLGFLWVGWDREKQGWHDKIAGTTVVRLPRGKWML